MPLTRTAKTPIHLVSSFAPNLRERPPYEELEEPLHPSNDNQDHNHSHDSVATNNLSLGGGKSTRGVAREDASRARSSGKKKRRVPTIGTVGLKTEIEMSQMSDISRTQSPASSAFPSYFRREKNAHAVESLPELPNSDGCPSEPNNKEEDSRDSRGEGRRKDAVYYAPIPEKQRLGYMSTAALIINKMIGTGIFSKPSSILRQTGSKGGALFLWVTGGVMTLTGLFVYLEFGVALPFNGGELVYLDEAYTRPRYLASCMFAVFFVLLGNTAANTISFAKHMLVAFNDSEQSPDYRLQRFVALVCITFICLIHLFSRKMGIFINNALAAYKVGLLLFVVVSGFVCLGGGGGGDHEDVPYGAENLQNAFEESSGSPYSYASAMLGVLYSYQGWENANYVLAEVKRPRGHESRTFKRAALVAFTIVTLLYILGNVAYFAASTTEEITQEGATVAARFFTKVFGNGPFVNRGLKVLVALSAFGNVVAVTYANSRVKQEIAKQRILPFSKFWASTSPYGTPVGALILHWIFTVIVIVATPNYTAKDEAYNLVSVLFTYGHTWVGIFVSLGLITLPFHEKFSEWRPTIVSIKKLYGLVALYITLNVFVIVLIWWPATTDQIRSYVAPSVGTSVLAFGVLYWVGFAKVLPALGYHIDSEPDELVDGSRAVTYKRYKTGPALVLADWWERTFKRRQQQL
ncbi:hypothetical protein C7212DRAFT_295386 [Tuber magnatum]|uniref:Amino acid transporter n=1 Tax=Tuber magnatum TaxID=42249 RepID=A0A317SQQ9_9PEZI|nr:hypothetical protein C7212DRAFT_295386 [Tuber magnatum]